MNKHTDCIKAHNHTLDFLDLQRNKYLHFFFLSNASNVGMFIALKQMTTNTCSPGQVV